MHICLPDTLEVRPEHGSAYLLYNVHIDGLYHCSLRYKQLLHLHQALSKRFSGPYHQLPPFPPKKLLPLSAGQVEERRSQLEKYLQNISQDKEISNSSIFNFYLLEAQRESTQIGENQAHLDVELVNGQKIRLPITTHDSTDAVLTAVCRALGVKDSFHAYFCLCLCGYDVIRDKLIIKRRLSFFESPYITLQMAIQQQDQLQKVLSYNNSNFSPSSTGSSASACRRQGRCSQQLSKHHQQYQSSNGDEVPLVGSSEADSSYVNNCGLQNPNYHQYHQVATGYHNPGYPNQGRYYRYVTSSSSFVTQRILLRKSYWDPIYDSYLLNDQQALNLLFIQTVYDMKHSLMFVNKETYHQLESLLASNSKLEYILLARTLRYYNYVHFEPCLSDYPRPGTRVMISIGSKELNMRVLKHPKQTLSSLSNDRNRQQQQQQQQQSVLSQPQTTSSSSTASSAASSACSSASSSASSSSNHHISLPSTPAPPPNPLTLASPQQHQSPSQPQHNSGNNSRATSENVLYCTSSLVPSNYRHLITKDDIVEEEYSFKVPLIRCWRLTSLETLNSNPTMSQPHCSSATTSLVNAPGPNARQPRKGFSLFNSVIGTSSAENRQEVQRHIISSGTGGNSLMTALAGHNRVYMNCQSARSSNNESNNRCCDDQMGTYENLCCNYQQQPPHQQFSQYELSFEYLISKSALKWITISSDQAIFISISLQGVVDELVSKRDGRLSVYNSLADRASALSEVPTSQPSISSNSNNNNNNNIDQQKHTGSNDNQSFTYMNRNGALRLISNNNQQLIDKFGTTLGYSPVNQRALAIARQRQYCRAIVASSSASFPQPAAFLSSSASSSSSSSAAAPPRHSIFEISTQNFKKAPSPIINDAFEGVTNDDDL